MKTIVYRITLLEPALVTSLQGDPNSAVAHDYLPGSVLRGALIGLAMRRDGFDDLDAADEAVRRRFLDGRARFLNGYPVISDGQQRSWRSLPAPRSWEQDKHAQGSNRDKITDRALQSSSGEQSAQQQELVKPKSLGGKFCALVDGRSNAYIVEPKHVINVHTERDRQLGRSLGDKHGTIYRYDALAAGQVFEAMIMCDEEDDAAYLSDLIDDDVTTAIGGARSAGYGRVALSQVHIYDAQREVSGPVSIDSGELVLTLLSDAILRDSNGQFAPDAEAFCTAIAGQLDLEVTELVVDQVFKNEGVIGGFNRKWGLPLPQTPTIAMGSVFVIGVSALSAEQTQALPDKLGWLEWRGIGERRAEGFGRLAVNWQQHATLKGIETAVLEDTPAQITLSHESKQLWDTMQARMARQRVDQEQIAQANALQLRRLPPKSQINRLRQMITSELLNERPDVAVITRFLGEIRGKKAAQHFDRARVGNQPMTDWLKQTAEQSHQDHYATLRLVDAVLARAAKLKKQEDGRAEVAHE